MRHSVTCVGSEQTAKLGIGCVWRQHPLSPKSLQTFGFGGTRATWQTLQGRARLVWVGIAHCHRSWQLALRRTGTQRTLPLVLPFLVVLAGRTHVAHVRFIAGRSGYSPEKAISVGTSAPHRLITRFRLADVPWSCTACRAPSR